MHCFLIPTSILLFLSCLIAIKNKKYEKILSVLFGVISFFNLLILSGLRGLNVGMDTQMYVRLFNRIAASNTLDIDNDRFELGYILYQYIISRFTSDPHALIFCSSLIILCIIYIVFYKESKLPWFSVLMFMTLMFFYDSMNMMRQYLSIALTFLAIHFLKEDKKLLFVCITVVAGLFHTSAFVILILFPLSYVKLDSQKRYIYILISTVIALGTGQLLPIMIKIMPIYSKYLTSDQYFQQNKLGIVLKALVYFLFFLIVEFSYRKNSDGSKKEQVEYWMALLGFVITLASVNGSILSRMGTYFTIMFCVSVPNSIVRITNPKKKIYLSIGIISGCLMYNLVILIWRPYWSGVLPYTLWQ
ncbi:MAG: EpsG family protein [Ruminococcus flavefaciens]|nr:EpsG family protein [Ruminococcus flavefaciens]MCM1060888.1 EpsG family protein [Eubacterium sp.]